MAFRFITADTHPDHDTLATFRKRFLKEMEGLFVQILMTAKVMGLLKLGTVSLDGTKIKANASKHKAMSWGATPMRLKSNCARRCKRCSSKLSRPMPRRGHRSTSPMNWRLLEARLAAIEKAKKRDHAPRA